MVIYSFMLLQALLVTLPVKKGVGTGSHPTTPLERFQK